MSLKKSTRSMIKIARRRKADYPADERRHVAGELRWHRKNRGRASAMQEFKRA